MVVKEHGERRGLEDGEKLYNHVDLVQLLDIVDLEAGAAVAGALRGRAGGGGSGRAVGRRGRGAARAPGTFWPRRGAARRGPGSGQALLSTAARPIAARRILSGPSRGHLQQFFPCRLETALRPRFAGNRGYYLKREGVLLNQALINAALQFGYKRGFQPVHTPFFMQASPHGRCRLCAHGLASLIAPVAAPGTNPAAA